MDKMIWFASLLALGCASAPRKEEPPLGTAGHQAEAARHEKVAADEDSLARREGPGAVEGAAPRCVEPAMTPEPTSGGEPLMLERPCWTVADPATSHRRIADQNRQEADAHRRAAKALEQAETTACAGLGSAERAHSPFAHPEDIVTTEEVRMKGKLRGARVVFRKVQGLDRAWMEKSLACHAARVAAMGYDTDVMPYCPVAVRGVTISVDEVASGIQVTLLAKDDTSAAVVWGRVQDLVSRRRPE